MLKKLELACFRKHESLSVTFTEGLNAIRAANEGGKTTLLEGIGYAFFGASALRDKLDDVVMWGCKLSQLKSVAHYGDYVFSRSKGGAEVTKNGQVLVTGQTEVTAFASQLLGCDPKVAANLMFAGQGGLRGILESGPTAAANLIEDLGEFDLFDKILAAAETKLALGSSAIQADRIKNLQAQLDSISIMPNPQPLWEARRQTLEKDKDKLARMNEVWLATREAMAKLVAEEQRIERLLAEVRGLAAAQARANERTASLELDIEAATPVSKLTTMSVEALVQQIAAEGERERMYAEFKAFKELPVYVPTDRAKHEARTQALRNDIETCTSMAREYKTQSLILEAQVTVSSTCGYCGQDVSQFPEVATRNTALVSDVQELHRKIVELEAEESRLRAELAKEMEVEELDVALIRATRTLHHRLNADESTIPVSYTWNGPVPKKDGPDIAELKRILEETKAQNDVIIAARSKCVALTAELAKAEKAAADITESLKEYPPKLEATLLEAKEETAKVVADESQKQASIQMTKANIQSAEQALESDIAEWTRSKQRMDDIKVQITDTEKEVETLAFNNMLVKKVRAARPIIGNKLWSMVLASVSAILSTMRGEQSIVAKGKEGFTVNGHVASSLSGSTLDLLGLAIRCALIKTFVPGTNFLVLDEPSAACDQGRTNSMLGYIAASGFGQVLLVTHNEQSERFANNLIQL